MIGSRLGNKIVACLPTALASSVAVFSVPALLHSLLGVPYSGAFTGAVMLTITMTLAMGAFAKLPFVVVPSVGTCAVLANLCVARGIDWQSAMGIAFWTGLVFLALSFTSLRERFAVAIPVPIRQAAAISIGFLLLKSCWMLLRDATVDSHTPFYGVTIGLVATILAFPRLRSLALCLGFFVTALAAGFLGEITFPNSPCSLPDLVTVPCSVKIFDYRFATLIAVMVTMFCTDLIDSLSTFVSVSESMGVDHSKSSTTLSRGLFVDSLATFVAPLLGTTPGSTSLQSTVGVIGGRADGKDVILIALLFLPCLFFSPLALAVPAYAIAPLLLVVGTALLSNARSIYKQSVVNAASQSLTIIAVIISDSLASGVLVGCLAFRLLPLMLRHRAYPTVSDIWQTGFTVSYLLMLG